MRLLLFKLSILLGAWTAYGQDENQTLLERTVVDDVPVASARYDALGGAVMTITDGLEAAFYNPAGIGGVQWGKAKLPAYRKVYFPYAGATLNENSKSLDKAFRDGGASSNREAGQAVIDAAAGERQYARASLVTGLVWGRAMLVPFSDNQVAAVSQGSGTGKINAHYRSTTGVGAGFSVQDASGQFSLGYFGAAMNVSDTKGSYIFNDMLDKTTRSNALKATTNRYSGVAHNFGLIWQLSKNAAPTIGLSVLNAGDTQLKRTKEADPSLYTPSVSSDSEDNSLSDASANASDTLVYKKNLSIGFSVSPKVGKMSYYNVIVQGSHLNDHDLSLAEKFSIGMEYNIGGQGNFAEVSFRAGYNHAGGAGGVMLSLGIIGVEVASKAVDIGADNKKVIERRNTGIFRVNVADF